MTNLPGTTTSRHVMFGTTTTSSSLITHDLCRYVALAGLQVAHSPKFLFHQVYKHPGRKVLIRSNGQVCVGVWGGGKVLIWSNGQVCVGRGGGGQGAHTEQWPGVCVCLCVCVPACLRVFMRACVQVREKGWGAVRWWSGAARLSYMCCTPLLFVSVRLSYMSLHAMSYTRIRACFVLVCVHLVVYICCVRPSVYR